MQCCICLQPSQNPIRLQCCSNEFCAHCLEEWKRLRNVCPLCKVKIGPEAEVNKLKNQDDGEFDNGFMMIENEVEILNNKIKYLKEMLANWHSQAKLIKSTVRKDHLQFLEDQLALVQEYQNTIHEALVKGDRVSSVNYLQLSAELIFTVEAVLNGQSTDFIENYEEDYEVDDYQEEFYEDYEEFEELEWKHGKSNRNREPKATFKQKTKSKKSIA